MERRVSGGDELDARIREAEEKIRRSTSKRTSRQSLEKREEPPEGSAAHPRRHDTYRRSLIGQSNSDQSRVGEERNQEPAQATLRRSATLSSASNQSRRTEILDTPDRQSLVAAQAEIKDMEQDSIGHAGYSRIGSSGREREQSGGSSSSGKRRPLPAEFRNASPVCLAFSLSRLSGWFKTDSSLSTHHLRNLHLNKLSILAGLPGSLEYSS